MSLETVRDVAALRERVAAWHGRGERVALVPTMGALHDGHLSLVRAARSRAERVVVTLFVNPKQFNSRSDLDAYPRTEEEDRAKLAPLDVDLLYAPGAEEIYPPGFATTVSVSGVSEGLCGAYRPGHFDGVATVVAKLFLQSQTDIAVFGEKDFQQLHVIRRMARDLDIPIEIVGCPTIREPDGLALSSRNVRLSAREREVAPRLAAALHRAARRIADGEDPGPVIADERSQLANAGFREVEYFELRAADDLAPLQRADRPGQLLAAVWLGETRLIDNVPVPAAAGASPG
ncbi:pantoate--beta-alanine ligase [Lutibaculum baratangense]|uniref:Pantothenate synthetase n=1 Tax=Lutibaculum baratangense AMV1 TaxID=631454 RepID=V4TCL0_9HYPH|nr:pantoate--beta-alanine ligase [Lutibaculum baratangense]ESR24043.1 Pantoate--beta-alanine ligase [Lutibaculum baratangense AMV1]